MFVLVPLVVTDAMRTSSSIAEPAATETAWASGGTYLLGDMRIRATTHRVYECVLAHTGVATLPENDPTRWIDRAPTLKWAAYDGYISTKSIGTGTYTDVLRPGFTNAISIYGAVGSAVSVVIKDGPGGATAFTYTGDLIEPYPGFYELLTRAPRQRSKLLLSNLPLLPDPEITITITAGASAPVGAGLIALGDLRKLIDDADWGGTQNGAQAQPVTFSYIDFDKYGNLTIARRPAATDLDVKVIMPRDVADYALTTFQEVLDVPCAWIATDVAGYAGLNVFGLGSGNLSYDSFNHAIMSIKVKGII